MSYNSRGILKAFLGEKTGVSPRNGNPWKIAEFLLEIPGNYVKHQKFEVSDGQQQRIARFSSMIGKYVEVSFDIDANEHDGRWFNKLQAWGIMEVPMTQAPNLPGTSDQQQ